MFMGYETQYWKDVNSPPNKCRNSTQFNSSRSPKKLLWGTEQAEYKLYEEDKGPL